MDDLQRAREEIDVIDEEMAALFVSRMQAAEQVARYKAATGKAVFDPAREQEILSKCGDRIKDKDLLVYYRAFLQQTIALSSAYQRMILGRDVAAYQGVEGAWSHIVLRKLLPFARAQAYSTWAEVCEAVLNGQAQFGVLPFENSNAGDVSTVLDLLWKRPELRVTVMADLPIRQDLLALPGAKLSDIRTVVSHQQALDQSRPFLQANKLSTRDWSNTADAARYVAESHDKSLAAIASAETAALYGLEILVSGVNEDGDNTTRFILVERNVGGDSPCAASGGQRLGLLFTVEHKPGRLARAIEYIGGMGFNMECIKSRPLPHIPFEYYFYVQLICQQDLPAQAYDSFMRGMENLCQTIRLLGVFDLKNVG